MRGSKKKNAPKLTTKYLRIIIFQGLFQFSPDLHNVSPSGYAPLPAVRRDSADMSEVPVGAPTPEEIRDEWGLKLPDRNLIIGYL